MGLRWDSEGWWFSIGMVIARSWAIFIRCDKQRITRSVSLWKSWGDFPSLILRGYEKNFCSTVNNCSSAPAYGWSPSKNTDTGQWNIPKCQVTENIFPFFPLVVGGSALPLYILPVGNSPAAFLQWPFLSCVTSAIFVSLAFCSEMRSARQVNNTSPLLLVSKAFFFFFLSRVTFINYLQNACHCDMPVCV